MALQQSKSGRRNIFTDGGCINNGKPNAKAAYAVFFADNCSFNFSGPVTDHPTNQKAELMAIQKALQTLHSNRDFALSYAPEVFILSDSMYSINCITKWSTTWEKNNWMTAKKQPVKHKSIICNCKKLLTQIQNDYNIKVNFVHVFSHIPEPDDKSSYAWKSWYGNQTVDKMVGEQLSEVNF